MPTITTKRTYDVEKCPCGEVWYNSEKEHIGYGEYEDPKWERHDASMWGRETLMNPGFCNICGTKVGVVVKGTKKNRIFRPYIEARSDCEYENGEKINSGNIKKKGK